VPALNGIHGLVPVSSAVRICCGKRLFRFKAGKIVILPVTIAVEA